VKLRQPTVRSIAQARAAAEEAAALLEDVRFWADHEDFYAAGRYPSEQLKSVMGRAYTASEKASEIESILRAMRPAEGR
jgi:hypothetical protein